MKTFTAYLLKDNALTKQYEGDLVELQEKLKDHFGKNGGLAPEVGVIFHREKENEGEAQVVGYVIPPPTTEEVERSLRICTGKELKESVANNKVPPSLARMVEGTEATWEWDFTLTQIK